MSVIAKERGGVGFGEVRLLLRPHSHYQVTYTAIEFEFRNPKRDYYLDSLTSQTPAEKGPKVVAQEKDT
ncbi:hypothetical protein PoB_001157200 [Plakobranchus ocellatus]|uniref:Uncharacterized protein n=1 Tax=Plakobranchus ocellatus TaxID=259542 RepID=A0AAV3YQ09_9GAST|nr:hypothetical protein PoB_001157200 [Plakobranchus ocellatus]